VPPRVGDETPRRSGSGRFRRGAGAGAGSRSGVGARSAAGPLDEADQTPERVREAALRLLDRQRRTRSDLARRLREKGFALGTIDPVLDRLTEVGLIDDVEYARAFLAGRWGRRAAGWRRLEQQLRMKGVPAPDILAARAKLEEREGNVDEVTAARRAITQAARRYAHFQPHVRRQKLWALLSRRGFDGDVIDRALREPDPGE
jgi:regulatory protein